MEPQRFTFIRKGLLTLGAISLLTLLASGEAQAQSIWTHAASACAVDETSAAKYAVGTTGAFYFASGQTGTIVARCNVTNPRDDGDDPLWNYLEVAYRDPDGAAAGSQVIASLYRLNPTTGGWTRLVTFDSNAFAATGYNVAGTAFPNGFFDSDFDFDAYAYLVEIQVRRSDTANNPLISTVRLVRPTAR